jgi:hypothetical protein
MKKLPAATVHCRKIGGALRGQRVSVMAMSFDLCSSSLQQGNPQGLDRRDAGNQCTIMPVNT